MSTSCLALSGSLARSGAGGMNCDGEVRAKGVTRPHWGGGEPLHRPGAAGGARWRGRHAQRLPAVGVVDLVPGVDRGIAGPARVAHRWRAPGLVAELVGAVAVAEVEHRLCGQVADALGGGGSTEVSAGS